MKTAIAKIKTNVKNAFFRLSDARGGSFGLNVNFEIARDDLLTDSFFELSSPFLCFLRNREGTCFMISETREIVLSQTPSPGFFLIVNLPSWRDTIPFFPAHLSAIARNEKR